MTKSRYHNPFDSSTKIIGAIIIVIFLFATGFIAGYEAHGNYSAPNPTSNSSLMEGLDQTHKLYQNSPYKYFVDYPIDWDAAEVDNGESVYFYHSNRAAHDPREESHISITAIANHEDKKLHDWLAERNPSGQYTEEKINIQGIAGMKVLYSSISGMESIYLPHSDIVLEATFRIHENSQQQLDLWKNYFEALIMSLRFVRN